jgi:hypothetical protein
MDKESRRILDKYKIVLVNETAYIYILNCDEETDVASAHCNRRNFLPPKAAQARALKGNSS